MTVACPNRCEIEAQLPLLDGGVNALPKNFALIDTLRPSTTSEVAKADTELARLEAEKKKAVESEDYDLAKRLKAQIDALRQTSISANCKVELIDLGAQGQLLRIDPRSAEPQPGTRPTAVVVLDRSPSMGDTVRWAINMAMPEALRRLGYEVQDRIIVITFDSVAERIHVEGGRDPTVAHLPTIDIKARGRTTLMTGAMQLLGQILQAPGRYNVFVISDGFLKDMEASLQEAEEAVRRVPASTIGAFALFRFFNGSPPDTQALAAAASMGTTGLAPCTDCVIRRDTLQEAMEDFCRTAEEAFGGTSSRHVVVEAPALQRIPLKDRRHQSLRLEIPTSSATTLLLPPASRSGGSSSQTIRINGTDHKVELAENQSEILAEYATFALAQLRLWLVGRIRKEDLQEATAWFKQASETDSSQQGGAVLAGSCGLLERAKKQAWQKANSETPMARIAALIEMGLLIHTLTSKQQGDFLRGGSVARADRLVIRRALGSDIIYHDNLRQSLPDAGAMAADLPSGGAPDGSGEAAFVSSYGGGEYLDILHAAAVLAPVTEDLSAPEVLQVIGGLGIPFAADLPRRTDDPWGLEVTSANPSAFLNEADVWAARQEGNPLKLPSRVTGVVPLAMCSTQAHECYINGVLQPVALLQLASQLRGELPEKPWGWDQAPPFSFLTGIAAREAAVLMCLASESLGSTRQPSQHTATLLAQLVQQLQEKSQHCPALTVSDLAADIGLRPKHSMLQAFAAVVADQSLSSSIPASGDAGRKDEVAAAARSLYMLEVHGTLQRRGDEVGLPAHAKAARCAAAVSLLAEDPASQQLQVQRDVVLMHINSRLDSGTLGEIEIPSVDTTVAGEEVIAERLQAMQWVPSLDRVLGTFRLHAAGADASRLQNDDPISPAELFFNADQGEGAAGGNFAQFLRSFRDANLVVAAVLASMLCPEEDQLGMTGASASAKSSTGPLPSLARRLDSREHARMELKKILHRALITAYTSRLREEVSRELAEMKAKKAEESRSANVRGSTISLNDMPLSLDRGLPPDGWGPRRKDLPHLPFVLCGPCDSGKSTLGMRLLFELGHVGEREMTSLCQEAQRLGKPSFTFAFGLDRRKEERERGLSMGVKKREFFSDRWHFTMIDVPGHRSFLKAMLNGMAQVDLAVLVVTTNPGDFARGIHQCGVEEGQARTNALLLRAMGVQNLIVCVNKMDNGKYGEELFKEVVSVCKDMLKEVGFHKDFINKSVVFLPTCGWSGENLVTRSASMPWWSGTQVESTDSRTYVTTLAEALNATVSEPSKDTSATALDSKEFLMPITGVFRIKGVGRVVTGRVLAGEVAPGETIQYFGAGQSLRINVKTIEMHCAPHEVARRGDIVGLAVTPSEPAPCVGDVLTHAAAGTAAARALQSFEAKVFLASPPGDIQVGWSPQCFAHTARGCVALRRIMWKERGGVKEENPSCLKKGDMALVEFQVLTANFYVEPFEKRRFLGRLLLVDGHHVVMIGQVTSTTAAPAGKAQAKAKSYGYSRR